LEGWKHPIQLSADLLFLTLLNLKDYGFKYQLTRIGLLYHTILQRPGNMTL